VLRDACQLGSIPIENGRCRYLGLDYQARQNANKPRVACCEVVCALQAFEAVSSRSSRGLGMDGKRKSNEERGEVLMSIRWVFLFTIRPVYQTKPPRLSSREAMLDASLQAGVRCSYPGARRVELE
jgi:hypothetical protein